jgi:hypothetical protein
MRLMPGQSDECEAMVESERRDGCVRWMLYISFGVVFTYDASGMVGAHFLVN